MPFLTIVLFSFLKPAGFELNNMHSVNVIINMFRIIFSIIIVIKYLKLQKKISIYIMSQFVFFIIWVFIYYIHDDDVFSIGVFSISCLVLTLLTDFCTKISKEKNLINAYLINYILLLSYNLYYIIVTYGWKIGMQNGIYETFSFLNSDNGTAGYIFPALYLMLVEKSLKISQNKKNMILKSILIIGLSLLNELRMWSATALAGIVLVLIYIFLIRNMILIKMKWVWVVTVVLNIGITFFRIQYLFSFIIEKVLNKSLTFTGRTKIWDWGMNAFYQNPIIGNGADGVSGKYYIDNLLIQLLYRGGIIFLIAFIVMIYFALKNGGLLTKNNKETKVFRDTYCIISIIALMSIAESWNSFMGFYIILSFVAANRKLQPNKMLNN